MADNNLPASAGPDVTTPDTTFDGGVEDITKLLSDDPVTDPVVEKAEDQAAPTTEEDDPLGLNVEAEDVETVADETEDGSGEIKGGRFAPDSAKVTLDDNTVITVGELRRNNLFQRDYTKKTTELKAEKDAFDAERATWSQEAQSLSQFREYASWYAENLLPKQPTPPADQNDYVGWHNYRQKLDEWNAHAQAYQAFQQNKQAEEARAKTETDKQAEARLARERDALLKAMPVLKDPVKGKATWDAIVSGAVEHYGITAEEVNSVGDHRMLVALRDALAYRRIKSQAPQVTAEVAKRPPTVTRRAPANQQPVRERQALSERLSKSGSVDDAVAVLTSLNI